MNRSLEESPSSLTTHIPPAPNETRRHPQSNPSETENRLCRICQNCYKPEQDGQTMRKCGACKVDRYCDKNCQKEAWPSHKAICKMHREAFAKLHSRPADSVERSEALRDFTRKHRRTISHAACLSVCHFYLPPHTANPAAAAREREDVLFIELQSRPNAQRARVETRLFVTGAQLGTMDLFPEGQREAMHLAIRTCRENTTRHNGPCGVILVAMILIDPDLVRGNIMNVVPVALQLDQPSLLQGMKVRWNEYLLHMLNEGIVL